jgi:hypothetical protein
MLKFPFEVIDRADEFVGAPLILEIISRDDAPPLTTFREVCRREIANCPGAPHHATRPVLYMPRFVGPQSKPACAHAVILN